MLDRLLRGLVGRKPAESERRSASGTAGPALLPLAQRVVDHYRNTPPPRGADVEAEARAFTEELLQDADPADLVASLIISHAAITVALRAEGPGSAHVGNGYRSIMSHGLARLVQIPVQNWGLSDRQIRAVLDFYASCSLIRTAAWKAACSSRGRGNARRAAVRRSAPRWSPSSIGLCRPSNSARPRFASSLRKICRRSALRERKSRFSPGGRRKAVRSSSCATGQLPAPVGFSARRSNTCWTAAWTSFAGAPTSAKPCRNCSGRTRQGRVIFLSAGSHRHLRRSRSAL